MTSVSPAVFVIALETVMSPTWEPVLPVVIVTLVPPSSLLLMSVLRIVELLALGVQVSGLPPFHAPFALAPVIVTL